MSGGSDSSHVTIPGDFHWLDLDLTTEGGCKSGVDVPNECNVPMGGLVNVDSSNQCETTQPNMIIDQPSGNSEMTTSDHVILSDCCEESSTGRMRRPPKWLSDYITDGIKAQEPHSSD